MFLSRDIFDSIIQLLIIFIQNIKSLSKNDKFIRFIISLDADEKFAIISSSNDIYKLIQDILAMDKEGECEMNENNLLILNNEGAFLNCIKLTEFIKKY